MSRVMLFLNMKRLLPFFVVGLLLFLAGGLIYQFASPRLVSVEPVNGQDKVHPGTALHLTFSRQMDQESVLQYLQITPFVDGDISWEGKTMIFKPDGGWPAGEQIQVTLSAGATATGLLPLPLRQDFQSSFRVNQPRLAYLYPANGLSNLYAIEPETGEIELLVDFQAGILDFIIDWEDNVIYFSGRNTAGGSDILQVDLVPESVEKTDSTTTGDSQPQELVRIITCQVNECRAPAVSPSARYLAFEQTVTVTNGGSGYPQVLLVALTEQGLPAGDPMPVGDATHQTSQPSWSAKGWLVIYDSTTTSFIFYDPDRGEIARLPNESGETGSWSPDGSVFVVPEYYYLDDTLPGGVEVIGPVVNSRLIAFHPENEMVEDLSGAQNLEDMLPSFSPDGYNLAFARRYLGITQWTPGKQLWIMPFSDNTPAGDAFPLSNAPYYTHYDFVWSPDSNRLAYVRFNQTTLTEPPEIWFIDPLNLEGKQLIIGGVSPQWIP
jgi:hypothetical protein